MAFPEQRVKSYSIENKTFVLTVVRTTKTNGRRNNTGIGFDNSQALDYSSHSGVRGKQDDMTATKKSPWFTSAGQRPHGSGSVYLREGSRVYVMAYKDRGKLIRQTTGETSRKRAIEKLNQRLAEVRTGTYLGPEAERVTVQELAEDTLRDHAVQGHKDLQIPSMRWEVHLKPVFAHLKAAEVTRPMIDKYVAARLKEGASNSTVNRELSFLKRAFRLGLEHEKVYRVPAFPHLVEDNVREGFPTDAQYDQLKKACSKEGLWLRAMLELAATFGWRKRSLLTMRVQNVDLMNGTIRQEGSTTKSGEGNEVKMTPDLQTLIAACASGKDPHDFLFTRDLERGDRPIRDFRRSWCRVTVSAGCPDLHFHDLCRKSARDLDIAGISQAVAMQLMGRKTPSIYRRYDIVDRRDLNRAVDRLTEHKARQAKAPGEIDSQFGSQYHGNLLNTDN